MWQGDRRNEPTIRLRDYPLRMLADGLVRLPTGENARHLTACVKYACKSGERPHSWELMISDVPWLVGLLGLNLWNNTNAIPPLVPGRNLNVEALRRWNTHKFI